MLLLLGWESGHDKLLATLTIALKDGEAVDTHYFENNLG
jgi:hypothetical protein